MQLHVSVMFNMHKKWSGSVVYAATETRVSRLNMFLPRFRLRILAISSCVDFRYYQLVYKYRTDRHSMKYSIDIFGIWGAYSNSDPYT